MSKETSQSREKKGSQSLKRKSSPLARLKLVRLELPEKSQMLKKKKSPLASPDHEWKLVFGKSTDGCLQSATLFDKSGKPLDFGSRKVKDGERVAIGLPSDMDAHWHTGESWAIVQDNNRDGMSADDPLDNNNPNPGNPTEIGWKGLFKKDQKKNPKVDFTLFKPVIYVPGPVVPGPVKPPSVPFCLQLKYPAVVAPTIHQATKGDNPHMIRIPSDEMILRITITVS